MKKIDLIHTTILIVAILAGYSALQYIIYVLSSVAYVSDLYYLRNQSLAYYLIMAALFAAVCIILIRNGRKYSALLLKDEPEGSWDEAMQWQLDRTNILLVLFIGMGLYTLIQSIPYVISDFFDFFRDKVGPRVFKEDGSRKGNFIIELLHTTIGAFLIYAAPALTNFINKKVAGRLDSDPQL